MFYAEMYAILATWPSKHKQLDFGNILKISPSKPVASFNIVGVTSRGPSRTVEKEKEN